MRVGYHDNVLDTARRRNRSQRGVTEVHENGNVRVTIIIKIDIKRDAIGTGT